MTNRTLGIAGTAKNTGKTTAMSALMAQLRRTRPDIRLAITSIGYDGEYLDNVTGLPKPRIEMREGDLAAVAERCLIYSRAKMEVLEKPGIMTAMGPLLIGRITRAGKLVVGGPNKRGEVRSVLKRLGELGAELTIVDGALGRIVPLCEVDALILSTGASRRTDIKRLAEETHAMTSILTLPELPPLGRAESVPAVLSQPDYEALKERLSALDSVYIQGILGGVYLTELSKEAEAFSGKRILFENPMALLPIGDPPQVLERIEAIRSAGVTLGVCKSVRLVAVTVNPYYPRFRYSKNYYEPAYVDKEALHAAIAGSVGSIPVFDVMQQGAAQLTERLFDG